MVFELEMSIRALVSLLWLQYELVRGRSTTVIHILCVDHLSPQKALVMPSGVSASCHHDPDRCETVPDNFVLRVERAFVRVQPMFVRGQNHLVLVLVRLVATNRQQQGFLRFVTAHPGVLVR